MLPLLEDRLVSFETSTPFGLIRRRVCAGLRLPEVRPTEDDYEAAIERLGIAEEAHRRRVLRRRICGCQHRGNRGAQNGYPEIR